MEKIMSKTDTPNDHRPLTPLADNDLDAVSGGIFPGLNNIVADVTGDAVASAAGNLSQEMGTPQFFGWFFW
jgi:hypothetical protein